MENDRCFALKNVSFSYGEKPVLKDLSLEIPKGKIVTLMGSNGCGKSTLFQLLTKNLKPDSGQILLGDVPLEAMSLKEFSRKAAIVHQNNTAPGDLTVEQLVSYGRIPYTKMGRPISKEKDRKMVEQAMQITGTLALRGKHVHALSGGQRQRVWIAMAIAQGTKILLLDELTTYLDSLNEGMILKSLKAEQGRRTVVLVSHRKSTMNIADEVYEMENGRIS